MAGSYKYDFFFDEAFWSDVILMNKKGNDFLHLTEMTVQGSVLTDNVKHHIDLRKCSLKFIF